MTGSRRRVVYLLWTAAASLAVMVAVTAWSVIHSAGASGADASDPELVALGVSVYGVHCAACHGGNLEGEPDWRQRKADGTLPAPPHDETGHTWHHSDELLFRLTRDGPGIMAGDDYRSAMPAYAGILSDREIWAVLAYIKSRWPAEIQVFQSER